VLLVNPAGRTPTGGPHKNQQKRVGRGRHAGGIGRGGDRTWRGKHPATAEHGPAFSTSWPADPGAGEMRRRRLAIMDARARPLGPGWACSRQGWIRGPRPSNSRWARCANRGPGAQGAWAVGRRRPVAPTPGTADHALPPGQPRPRQGTFRATNAAGGLRRPRGPYITGFCEGTTTSAAAHRRGGRGGGC